MDAKQAKRLGKHLRAAREAKGLSARQLGDLVDLNASSIVRIENGEFRSPGADKLARIAEALAINAADVFALAEYSPPSSLPSMTPYLRTKYRDLPDEAVEQIQRYSARIAKKHGIALDGPAPGEDEDTWQATN